jgi:hypothetical protein
VVATLLVAGCSGDEPDAQPRKPSAPSTSPVATTSPSPTPPALPAAARRNSKAGAVAFAHHYIDLINYVRTSGDSNSLRRRSSNGCASCSAIAEIAEQTYARGGFLHGGDWSITSSSVFAGVGQQDWQIITNINVANQAYQPRAGAPVQHRQSEKATLIFTVSRARQQWTVTNLERQPNG